MSTDVTLCCDIFSNRACRPDTKGIGEDKTFKLNTIPAVVLANVRLQSLIISRLSNFQIYLAECNKSEQGSTKQLLWRCHLLHKSISCHPWFRLVMRVSELNIHPRMGIHISSSEAGLLCL